MFLLRLTFGLCSEFWFEDELQIYLLGLKHFTTGAWPYFGPDVVYTQSQIPGAIQGLLVGLPLHLLPVPEAPYLLLNLLSFAALCGLAAYGCLRVPGLPRWLIWSLALTLPWVLNFSTHVVNPSYVLVFATVFFIGLFERVVYFDRAAMPSSAAYALMGLGLFSVMQLHMSWPLLVILAALAIAVEAHETRSLPVRAAAWFLIGALPALALLAPTYAAYGFGGGGTGANVQLNLGNVTQLPTIVARFMSFASWEIPRFLGAHTDDRLAFLTAHPLLAPPAVFLTILGLIQPFALLWGLVIGTGSGADRLRLRGLTVFTIALLYGAFLFSIKGPASHTFYVTFPIAFLFSLHVWERLYARRGIAALAAAAVIAGVLFHGGLAAARAPRISMYRDRAVPMRAIQLRDYRILGVRRADVWGCCF